MKIIVTHSLQVSVLEDLNKPGRMLCVANTHLYFHPKGKTSHRSVLTHNDCLFLQVFKTGIIYFEGGNVRLVQMGVALQHLSHVIREVAPGAPLIFCGDFNSMPNSGDSLQPTCVQLPLVQPAETELYLKIEHLFVNLLLSQVYLS